MLCSCHTALQIDADQHISLQLRFGLQNSAEGTNDMDVSRLPECDFRRHVAMTANIFVLSRCNCSDSDS